jgi:hypothetical protein
MTQQKTAARQETAQKKTAHPSHRWCPPSEGWNGVPRCRGCRTWDDGGEAALSQCPAVRPERPRVA